MLRRQHATIGRPEALSRQLRGALDPPTCRSTGGQAVVRVIAEVVSTTGWTCLSSFSSHDSRKLADDDLDRPSDGQYQNSGLPIASGTGYPPTMAILDNPSANMTIARHLMVDFNQMKAFVEDPLVLDRGAGIRVTDTSGRTYIDGLSGVFTSNLGHANAEIIDAVTAQLGRLAFGAPTMATTSSALTLVDRILEFAPPPYTTMKFLSGGSEATEFSDEAGSAVPPPDRAVGSLQDPVALPRLSRRDWSRAGSERLADMEDPFRANGSRFCPPPDARSG